MNKQKFSLAILLMAFFASSCSSTIGQKYLEELETHAKKGNRLSIYELGNFYAGSDLSYPNSFRPVAGSPHDCIAGFPSDCVAGLAGDFVAGSPSYCVA